MLKVSLQSVMQLNIFKKNSHNIIGLYEFTTSCNYRYRRSYPSWKERSDFWNGLLSGKSGAKNVDRFDTTGFATTFATQIENYDPLQHFEKKEARKLDYATQYALIATDEAIKILN